MGRSPQDTCKARGVGGFPRIFKRGLARPSLRRAVGGLTKQANLGGRQAHQHFPSSTVPPVMVCDRQQNWGLGRAEAMPQP